MVIYEEITDFAALCERCRTDESQIKNTVESILQEVKTDKDAAMFALAERIDGVKLTSLEVSKEEKQEALCAVAPALKEAIANAAQNITRFHEAQLPKTKAVETQQGVRCLQKAVPIQRVGLYIPGGKAPLFSTVLMLALPAQIAGCKEVILCTPCDKQGKVNPSTLYAAIQCGIKHIYKVGGAQAIAAMAYGTQTIARVDKIFGPGNRFVTLAKQMVTASQCAIDMPAGPSEVLVVADESANPAFVAADLLSQAEHGADSQAMLVCSSRDIAEAVNNEIDRQKALLPREEIVDGALAHSRAIVLNSRQEQLDFVNAYAPEHLILSVQNPWLMAEQVTAAGSVFIGNYSPESAGDYASGTNHTLPTSGWARAYSGVNIDAYMRKITYQELTPQGLTDLSTTIITMAEAEGLTAHANAVRVRCQK